MHEATEGLLVSSDLVDLAKVKCEVCGEVVMDSWLRHHCKRQHSLSMPQYKQEFGPPKIVKKVEHKCAICGRLLSFSTLCIASHLHHWHKETNLKEYTSNFLEDSGSKSKSMLGENDKDGGHPGDTSAPITVCENRKEKSLATNAGSEKPLVINVVKPTNLPTDWNDSTLSTDIGMKPLTGSITSSDKPLKDSKKPLVIANLKQQTNGIKTLFKLTKGWEKTMAAGSLNPKMRGIDNSTITKSEAVSVAQLEVQQARILELTSKNNAMLKQQLEIMKTEQHRKDMGDKRKLRKMQELLESKEDQIQKLMRNDKSTYELYNNVKQVLEVNQGVNKCITVELELVNTELEAMKNYGMKQAKGLKRTRKALDSVCSAAVRVEERTGQVLSTVGSLGTGPGLVKPLQSRVDKMVWLSVETRENQAKMNMLLGELLIKPSETDAGTSELISRKKGAVVKENRIERDIECIEMDKREVEEHGVSENLQVSINPQFDESKDMMWGHNVALVGDGLLRDFYQVEEVRTQLTRMEKEANLVFLAHKGAPLSSQLHSVPLNCNTVVVSQGAHNLQDTGLLTLAAADSLEVVRQWNQPLLQAWAEDLSRMVVRPLLEQGKRVVLLVAPAGEERDEVAQQWQELLLASLPTDPGLQVLSMMEVIQSSLSELQGEEQCQETLPREKLTEYRLRKIFLALRQTLTELQSKSH